MPVSFGDEADYLGPGNWGYTWPEIWMNGGNDQIEMPSNAQYCPVHGGEGADTVWGSSNNDAIFGDGANDTLNGRIGNDHLYGGTGADRLTGGTGTDYFHFARGESNAVSGQADTIGDWNVANDYIDSSLAGTTSNYREAATSYTSIDSARWQVENSTLRVADHVFLYNAQTDTGYLLSDLDRNYSFETGVVINGAGSAADMAYSDII